MFGANIKQIVNLLILKTPCSVNIASTLTICRCCMASLHVFCSESPAQSEMQAGMAEVTSMVKFTRVESTMDITSETRCTKN